jgi:uncharacterized membrane protein
MMTTKQLQILKTITWTVLSFTITTLIGWAVTGSVAIGLSVGILDRIFKMAIYFAHERLWHKRYKALKALKAQNESNS